MGNNLKKGLFLLLILFFASFGIEFASAEEVTSSDFGIEQTGILPSNPFYFFKTWGRNIRQTFSFSDLARAELQLNILNEQAAEIRKLDELNVLKLEAFLRAVDNFEKGISALGLRMAVLKGVPGADKFVENFLDKALKYYDLLDVLVYKFENNQNADKLRESVADSLDKLVEVVLVVPNNIVSTKKFMEGFELASSRQRSELREFRAVEFVDRMELQASADLLSAMLRLKDSLLLKFSGRLQAVKIGDSNIMNLLEGSTGDILLRLKVIDEAREKIVDSDIKNQINIVRNRVFDKVRMKNLISEVTAKDTLDIAQDKLNEVASTVVGQSSKTSANVAQLIDRARFNFEEARKFYEEESFSSAYSQALSAGAAAENALSQVLIDGNDFKEELRNIKLYFDSLSNIARKAGSNIASESKISKEFKDAEKMIARLSDLISDNKNLFQIRKNIRELKMKTSLLSQMLE